MTINVSQVAARMKQVDQATVKGARVTVSKAALDAKTIIAAGSPSRLRNVGKSGAKLGIRYTIGGTATSPSARVKATGPWPIIESDIGPHTIQPKKKRRRSGPGSGRGGGIVVGGVVRRYAHHPGTKGKHPWAKGVEKAAPVVAKEMSRQTGNIVRAAFSG